MTFGKMMCKEDPYLMAFRPGWVLNKTFEMSSCGLSILNLIL